MKTDFYYYRNEANKLMKIMRCGLFKKPFKCWSILKEEMDVKLHSVIEDLYKECMEENKDFDWFRNQLIDKRNNYLMNHHICKMYQIKSLKQLRESFNNMWSKSVEMMPLKENLTDDQINKLCKNKLSRGDDFLEMNGKVLMELKRLFNLKHISIYALGGSFEIRGIKNV